MRGLTHRTSEACWLQSNSTPCRYRCFPVMKIEKCKNKQTLLGLNQSSTWISSVISHSRNHKNVSHNSADKDRDFLMYFQVSKGLVTTYDASTSISGKLCELTSDPQMYVSTETELTVLMVTDEFEADKGFAASYEINPAPNTGQNCSQSFITEIHYVFTVYIFVFTDFKVLFTDWIMAFNFVNQSSVVSLFGKALLKSHE